MASINAAFPGFFENCDFQGSLIDECTLIFCECPGSIREEPLKSLKPLSCPAPWWRE